MTRIDGKSPQHPDNNPPHPDFAVAGPAAARSDTPPPPEQPQPTAAQSIVHQALQGMAALLEQVPQRSALKCAGCVVDRCTWETQHEADVQAAAAQMQHAMAAIPPGMPRPPANLLQFLPPDVQATVPPLNLGETLAGGTLLCPAHLMAGQTAAARGPGLMLAQPGIDVRAFTQHMRQGGG